MNDEQLRAALHSMGQACFVRYYRMFADSTVSREDAIEVLRSETDYTERSCGTRTSNAKRIIAAGRGPDALRLVITGNASRDTRDAALELLQNRGRLCPETGDQIQLAEPRQRRLEPAPDTGAKINYLLCFQMPKPVKITGRSSSITNSFINSIIPVIPPTSDQVHRALEILGMDHESCQCAYCGSAATEWDHLRPLVMDKKPTGYISEIHNLVPSCGKCNQSKGNKEWATWMSSDAKLSPTTRGVDDIEIRKERLRAYEQWEEPTLLDFETIVGGERWEQHWANWKQVQDTMRHAQELANEISQTVGKYHKDNAHER